MPNSAEQGQANISARKHKEKLETRSRSTEKAEFSLGQERNQTANKQKQERTSVSKTKHGLQPESHSRAALPKNPHLQNQGSQRNFDLRH